MDEILSFWIKIRALNAVVPGSVTRYWSTPAHNAALGGAPHSWHLQGLAVDLVYDSDDELHRAFQAALELKFPGVELDLDNGHLHVDARTTPVWHVIHQHGTYSPLNGSPPPAPAST